MTDEAAALRRQMDAILRAMAELTARVEALEGKK